ncbi:hypothetical protein K505DRAFT_22772 [Melanomma pulvis-pyrius CBS 109.77]|uniref:Uncharacterized protein n=1 Tax=Melanomma pulvis-pyrius CBS 109.77 TaxID=1314802 RepID=A0A6A6XE65_9PLEO|nr:hypothetical protein K505DRAFT_22772 [Melanomma pulvis-pyrius CBS 109.77]
MGRFRCQDRAACALGVAEEGPFGVEERAGSGEEAANYRQESYRRDEARDTQLAGATTQRPALWRGRRRRGSGQPEGPWPAEVAAERAWSLRRQCGAEEHQWSALAARGDGGCWGRMGEWQVKPETVLAFAVVMTRALEIARLQRPPAPRRNRQADERARLLRRRW